ncbi:PREDICTED: myb-related protein Myb4-like [Tarenaya hassleriana]|uniref:myb-related protein Myb4-like n=1 Tax=Tarenaya hassleriana TaxID=28532 RepID=UPI00053C31E9|nr:PREDICTED: myb-related protein Myb4-like [Tarenaya hassleriana]
MGGGETAEREMKKGPWTAAEDAVLREYVKKHGEGSWNAVMKSSGLLRCGKSCRLRWANHLRPNLKKGSFTPDEEKIILHLHSKFGNKWARMASQLPGRTDNEIKNYWNTRVKRRKRAGLPLYPQEESTSFQFQNHKNHRSRTSPTSPSSSSSSRPCLHPFSSPTPTLDSSVSYQMFDLFADLDNDDYSTSLGFSLPLSTSSSSSDLCSQNRLLGFTSENSNINKNDGNKADVMSYSSLLMGEEMRPSSFPPGLDILELPSNQTHSFTCNESIQMPRRGNSGLLDALLEESRALSRGGLSKDENHISSSDHSSIGTNPNKNKYEEPTSDKTMMDDGDDDMLMSLLNNFPSSTVLLPDWYNTTRNRSNGSDFTSTSITLIGNIQSNGLDPSPASSSDAVTPGIF